MKRQLHWTLLKSLKLILLLHVHLHSQILQYLSIKELVKGKKAALFFGSEGYGLDKKTIKACDITTIIPMSHQVDSLNVAASSAVAFWELFAR